MEWFFDTHERKYTYGGYWRYTSAYVTATSTETSSAPTVHLLIVVPQVVFLHFSILLFFGKIKTMVNG